MHKHKPYVYHWSEWQSVLKQANTTHAACRLHAYCQTISWIVVQRNFSSFCDKWNGARIRWRESFRMLFALFLFSNISTIWFVQSTDRAHESFFVLYFLKKCGDTIHMQQHITEQPFSVLRGPHAVGRTLQYISNTIELIKHFPYRRIQKNFSEFAGEPCFQAALGNHAHMYEHIYTNMHAGDARDPPSMFRFHSIKNIPEILTLSHTHGISFNSSQKTRGHVAVERARYMLHTRLPLGDEGTRYICHYICDYVRIRVYFPFTQSRAACWYADDQFEKKNAKERK